MRDRYQAHFNGSPGTSKLLPGCGWIMYRNLVQVIAQENVTLPIGTTSNEAEWQGLLYLLKHIHKENYPEPVEIFGDSQLIVYQATGKYQVRNARLKVYHAAFVELQKEIREQGKTVAIGWHRREFNSDADALSHGVPRDTQSPN